MACCRIVRGYTKASLGASKLALSREGGAMRLRWVMLLACMLIAATANGAARVVTSFDAGWRFFKGDAEGAEVVGFDDSKWRILDVPHDWSIEGPFAATNPTGGAGAFLPAGVGWYRKHFVPPGSNKGRRIFIEFDGIMANSDVWINGAHLGKRPYGYVSFGYELTRHLFAGEKNVLAVRADNSGQPASRWYTGAGIYRHVRLVVKDPVHLVKWATSITTPRIAEAQAIVRVQGAIVNQSEKPRHVSLQIRIVSPAGKSAASVKTISLIIPRGETVDFQEEAIVSNPALWQLDHPNLYQAHLKIKSAKTVLDDEKIVFGIRDARFVPETGFWLNNRNVKIKGVCLHHDGGAFGAAVPLRVWERRLERLRTLGVNAIRTAHNPPAPEFLDLCDRMGFLVMEELFDCWTIGKTPFDYHLYFNEWAHTDVRDTVQRDRNHPSIILYSAGNEIRDTTNPELAKRILAGLVGVFHQYDPSRPVTQALFRPNVSRDYDNGLADLLDVVGTNYRDLELLDAWKAKPSRKIIGTEQRHDMDTWVAARDHAQHAGQFLWSGIDYLGESPQWPMISADFGLLDRTGAYKTRAYERRSWWSNKPAGPLELQEDSIGGQGPAARIRLEVDRSKIAPVWDDVAFVTASITDANGIVLPGSSDLVTFKITGPGVIAAVDNGDISSIEPFQGSERKAYQGRCYAMIKARAARGKIVLTASAPGFPPASITINAVSNTTH